MKLLLWDIDGTLLTTRGAGVIPFSKALSEIKGESIQINRLECSGLTDYQIAHRYLKGDVNNPEYFKNIDIALQNYTQQLESNLKDRPALSLPGIHKLLMNLESDKNFILAVVTGNCKRGAFIKLKSAQLDCFFDSKFVFTATDLTERATIVERALAAFEQIDCEAFVIGDTIHDIEAAKRNSINSIIFETVDFTISALASHSPEHLIKREWEIHEFMQIFENANN